ncbi:bifunctional riboflavin kinase/FAD synthetase [Proteinivorax hydrogeniformans]|uniref:Riboflavin biosynthesis protein n=1 Tax=Proteinivorax hydrogeniformans TaxID=1826727 RepID=A0AAU8HP41_9FIRM
MEVIFGLEKIKLIQGSSFVTIGNFDGYHKGHKQLVEKVKEKAKSSGGSSVIISFFPHPQSLFVPDFKVINPIEIKVEKLKKTEVDYLIIIPFTKDFAGYSPKKFVQEILINKLKCKGLVIGYDFCFGRNGEGNAKFLKKYSEFNTEVLDAVTFDNVVASSTLLRKALLDGDIQLFYNVAGEYPIYSGIVVSGLGLGKKMGFPTANFYLNSNTLYPKNGVYAVKVKVDGKTFSGVANFGTKPTIGNNKYGVEVHIFDLEKTLYGKMVCISLVKFLRSEQNFENKIELINQVNNDIKDARRILT